MHPERQLAIDYGGEYVDGDLTAIEPQPGVVRARREPDRRSGPGGGHVAYQHGVGLFTHAGHPQQAVGDRQPWGQPSSGVPVDEGRYRG